MMENEYQKVWLLKQEPEGPLVHYFDLIVSHLVEQGYCRKYIGRQLRVIAHFSLWLKRQKICASDVTLEYAERFIQEADQRHTVKQEMNSILRHLIEFLQQKHICKKTVHPINRTPVQQVVYSFGHYLLNEKGLSNKTLVQYNPFIERFLQSCFGHVPVRLSSLSGKDIIDFIKHEAARLSVARAKVATNALRAFLRYGVSLGDINADLIGSIPTVASWSMTGIPRAISPEHVQAVLDSCDRNTPIGKRDYAILMLLSHLGLRSGEIVSLTLDCIDWECSSIHVCGKGHQSTCLPIPFEVGQAIANYLQYGRPICNDRALFLRTLAPIRGLGAQQTIATIVNSAITRAGVVTPSRGAHQFRHAVATKMLAQGASLTEIGCLLGHKHPKTTNIYAKVDLNALRSLSLPWPGGVQ